MKRAVILLSGGMDSAVAAAIAKSEGYEAYVLFVNYGQKTKDKELECSKKLFNSLGLKEFKTLDLKFLSDIGGSALTDDSIDVPSNVNLEDLETTQPTYVPFRNTLLYSMATAWAEVIGAEAIFSGSHFANANPDNTLEYISAMQTVIYLGTKKNTVIKLNTPVRDLTKAEIVKKGLELGVDFSETWSCYIDSKSACGVCESCLRRYEAFVNQDLEDPIPYKITPVLRR